MPFQYLKGIAEPIGTCKLVLDRTDSQEKKLNLGLFSRSALAKRWDANADTSAKASTQSEYLPFTRLQTLQEYQVLLKNPERHVKR